MKIGTRICLTLIILSITTFSAESAGMKTVAIDVLYGGASGAMIGTGVSLIQNEPDWGINLRRGTGIGMIIGLFYGVFEVSYLSSGKDQRAIFNVEDRELRIDLPKIRIDQNRYEMRVMQFRF